MPIVMSMNRLQVGAPVPNEFSPYVTLVVWAELTNAWKVKQNLLDMMYISKTSIHFLYRIDS